jgi:hypothetical protein
MRYSCSTNRLARIVSVQYPEQIEWCSMILLIIRSRLGLFGVGHSSYALSGYRGAAVFHLCARGAGAERQIQELVKEAGLRYLRARKRASRRRSGE